MAELDAVAQRLPAGARVLELGAGTGAQAAALAARGFDVCAVDVESSNYAQDRVFPVVTYDGVALPFADAAFDVVFSSNVLEHVRELAPLHAETRRVLRPGGFALHVLPTDAWRWWTLLSAFPDAALRIGALVRELPPRRLSRSEARRLLGVGWRLLGAATSPLRQIRHGERGHLLTEFYYFRPAWWRDHFVRHGFRIRHEAPMGLFYTGHMVAPGLSFAARARLAKILGSATHLFELEPASRS